jgi:hypothetical protein
MSKLTKTVIVALLGWLGATLLVQAIGLSETAQALRGLWPFLGFLLAGVLVVAGLIALLLRKLDHYSAVVLVLGLVLLLLGPPQLERVGAWLHLQFYRQHYEAVVQQVMAAPSDTARQQICGKTCWSRPAPSWQVGFPYSSFFILWSEVIYDPAGELSQPGRQRNLLLRTWHLSGPWYRGDYGD